MQETAIDDAHAELIYGLVRAFKPSKILEFGIGYGTSGEQIVNAARYNGNAPSYTIVENWHDFGGLPVEVGDKFRDAKIITSTEQLFVHRCLSEGFKFDFIFSDADHRNADKWFDEVYNDVLESPGILVYHDVLSKEFPNLKTIYHRAVSLGLSHSLFSRETRPDERCSRGLLVIFKP